MFIFAAYIATDYNPHFLAEWIENEIFFSNP